MVQKNKKLKIEENEDLGFAFNKENYKLLGIGFVIIILGFILMIGGGAEKKFF
ncbi:MAG: hypothetical protein B6I24_10845 [Bacteroidetes bacterium 4572_128]|nr:MAG: hypothetical protein B6I24_10845 [Bacteroidetes bacterium 4572_128]